jgi:DNA-binding MarR family transcriptional regulator
MNWHDKHPSFKTANPLDCVAGKLIMSLRTVSAIYRRHLKKHRLTMSQWSILQVLAYHGEMPQAMLGKMLKLDRSTITRDLKRLLKKGYLERSGAINKKNVGLTELGVQFVENIIPDWQRATAEAGDLLGHDGMESLNIVLSKFFKYS